MSWCVHPGPLCRRHAARQRAWTKTARFRRRARSRARGALHAPVARCRQRPGLGLLRASRLRRAERADDGAGRRAFQTAGPQMKFALAGLAMLAATMAFADRAPVLKQIKVPHDYYYREMYLPQLTTGPSALSWSPDGRMLVYSMAGSLWKQEIGLTTAEQLTTGPGYDYEPDWSPDGKTIIFVRYLHDAEELYALHLPTGAVTQITQGGDVNLEPRWSPDGHRIAFVSTKGTGHFHIFIGTWGQNGLSSKPWMKERRSKTARYYYSTFGQQLSPTWSPDGHSLIYVDNPEIGHGTGALWRRTVDGRSPARLVHREETNWKAAPDWSRDGRRLVFSSYSGRQNNQLWLLTAAGDDYPFPITYGGWDATRPRWSPDSTHIAFI